jgi:hypothetical protein
MEIGPVLGSQAQRVECDSLLVPDPSPLDRSGLRLRLFRQQAQAGDITLLFGDESEALTHPYLARAWAKRGWAPGP